MVQSASYLNLNFKWGILKNKHVYFCLQFSKYDNIFCFVYNVQRNLLSYKIKHDM